MKANCASNPTTCTCIYI